VHGDDRAPRFAVIDVGTNSIKLHVGERQPGGSWIRVVDRAVITRLGEGLEPAGSITPAALERSVAAIADMAAEARSEGAAGIAAVGTAGLRAAANRDAVVAAIAERTGVVIEVISGEEEARLAFIAVEEGIGVGAGSLAVFDTGGGSTQLSFGHGGQVDERFSLDVGAVGLTRRFGLEGEVAPRVLADAMAAIATGFGRLDGHPRPDVLVGMGGAIGNIAAVMHGLVTFDPDVVQGTVLEVAEIDRQIEVYRSLDADARRSVVGLQSERAVVILAGACVVRTVMSKLQRTTLTVSDRGLRHGLLVERFGA
jgi:exopolyphosphatase/guanosine-5'-triphosphate,3'-diphosphate pyrophosphatase